MFKKIRAAFETRVTVSVTTPNPERFLNDCLRAGLLLQKISRTSPLELTAQMRAAEFRRLPKLVYGKHCRVRIRQKSGIARRVLPYLRRPFFLLGAVGTFLFLHFASGMLWSVSITNNGARDSEILEALAEFGLKPGVKLAELDEGQIKEQVIARLPHLSWVGIFLDGASAEIAYELRTERPQVIPNDEPCAIYAKKNGILTKLYVYQGTPIAAVGETVEKGDLLVGAEVPIGKEGNFVLSHALADAEARTWYEMTATVPATAQKKEYTGQVFTKKYLIFFEHEINLSPDYGKTPFGYDIIIEKKDVFYGVPCTLVTETWREYRTVAAAKETETEQLRLESALTDAISAGLVNGGISNARFERTAQNESISVTIFCECWEDIAAPDAYVPSPQINHNER